uniref:Glycosyltransferase n=1 Tax=Nelumbo nucifera TaxID=4432 RepID=A0A822YEK7_NELNU|nr:TPA_asm: hypothetical protein HUJ06_030863 [Nelumbo nucifera]
MDMVDKSRSKAYFIFKVCNFLPPHSRLQTPVSSLLPGYLIGNKMKETVVLYPAPGIGHLVSMVELAKLILHHNPQISLTVLLTTGPFDTLATTSYINQISQVNPSIAFHHFPPLSTPLDTSPTRSHAAITFEFIRLNDPNVRRALQSISQTSTIRSFVIDLFCTSALHISSNLDIPTYYFFTSGASILAYFFYLPTIHSQTTQSFKDFTTTYFHFPGLPPILGSHMVEPVLVRTDPAYDDFVYFTAHLPKSKGIIVNTFESLEPIAIKVISDGVCLPDAPVPPVYYVGPLISDASDRRGDSGGVADCLPWLDAQPSQSVVFLCFGSRGAFSVAQLKEIAHGLEKSGQRFLWVVKPPPPLQGEKSLRFAVQSDDLDLEALLPEGFLNRTKDRGLVVKSWAPQQEILSRESIGGFVTHCGWNSVLEAICAGVPMVAWPLYAEQFINRAVLVEQMKLVMPLDQAEDGFVSAAEVEKRVRALTESEDGRVLRERGEEMKKAAKAAWAEGGSSFVAFNKFAESWK